jgi:hypothetical protein
VLQPGFVMTAKLHNPPSFSQHPLRHNIESAAAAAGVVIVVDRGRLCVLSIAAAAVSLIPMQGLPVDQLVWTRVSGCKDFAAALTVDNRLAHFGIRSGRAVVFRWVCTVAPSLRGLALSEDSCAALYDDHVAVISTADGTVVTRSNCGGGRIVLWLDGSWGVLTANKIILISTDGTSEDEIGGVGLKADGPAMVFQDIINGVAVGRSIILLDSGTLRVICHVRGLVQHLRLFAPVLTLVETNRARPVREIIDLLEAFDRTARSWIAERAAASGRAAPQGPEGCSPSATLLSPSLLLEGLRRFPPDLEIKPHSFMTLAVERLFSQFHTGGYAGVEASLVVYMQRRALVVHRLAVKRELASSTPYLRVPGPSVEKGLTRLQAARQAREEAHPPTDEPETATARRRLRNLFRASVRSKVLTRALRCGGCGACISLLDLSSSLISFFFSRSLVVFLLVSTRASAFASFI